MKTQTKDLKNRTAADSSAEEEEYVKIKKSDLEAIQRAWCALDALQGILGSHDSAKENGYYACGELLTLINDKFCVIDAVIWGAES